MGICEKNIHFEVGEATQTVDLKQSSSHESHESVLSKNLHEEVSNEEKDFSSKENLLYCTNNFG